MSDEEFQSSSHGAIVVALVGVAGVKDSATARVGAACDVLLSQSRGDSADGTLV